MPTIRQILLIAVATMCASSGHVVASGITAHPQRVVFDRQRSAVIELAYIGSEPATYRLALVRKRMNYDGQLETITEPREGERFADDMIRFTPRQVTLQPGASQAIRLQLRKPANLEVGESRAHLVIQQLPPVKKEDASAANAKAIEVKLIPLYGLSIPILVRHGDPSVSVGIDRLTIERTGAVPALQLELQRSGDRSAYGDLSVSLIGRDGKERVIAAKKGVAVYNPNPARQIRIPLEGVDRQKLAAGSIRVVFAEREGARKKSIEARLALQ